MDCSICGGNVQWSNHEGGCPESGKVCGATDLGATCVLAKGHDVDPANKNSMKSVHKGTLPDGRTYRWG